jgi:hypothetical protein
MIPNNLSTIQDQCKGGKTHTTLVAGEQYLVGDLNVVDDDD